MKYHGRMGEKEPETASGFGEDMNDKIDIGEYRLHRQNDGTYWINKPEGQYAGEGMQTTEQKLIKMLNEFWDKEF